MGDQCNDSDQEQVHAVPSRRDALIAGAALVAAPFLGRVTSIVQAAQGANTVLRVGSPAHARPEKVQGTATEWLNYAGDQASSKYSPLTQISGDNFESPEGEVALPRNATGAPMTYMLNGKQFIVVATGGSNLPAELIALSLA